MTPEKQTIITIITTEGHDYDFLVSKSPFVVGRSSLSDLHLPTSVVSSRHFRVELEASPGSVVITDLASKNGTIADGMALETSHPTPFELPVEIEIADLRLRICLADREDESVSLSLDRSHSMSRLILNSIMRAKVAQYQAKLLVETGPMKGKELILSDSAELTRIGPIDRDFPLNEPVLEAVPAVISLVGATYQIEPHENVPLTVAGDQVKNPRRLRDGDRIVAGGTVLRFSDPIEAEVDEMEERAPSVSTSAVPAVAPRSWRPWTAMERLLFGFSIFVIVLSAVTLLMFLGIIPV